MAALEEKLNNDFKSALKSQDAIKVSVIRMLKADITNNLVKLNKKSLIDEEIIKIIQSHVRKHGESIEQFKKGNRLDLVEKEERELKILKNYLPEQMPDQELEALVKSAINSIGATSIKDSGKIIKIVLEKAKGKTDGKKVSQIVARLLTGVEQ